MPDLRVVAAACRVGELVISLPAPARHHHILLGIGVKLGDEASRIHGRHQGFLLSDGRYADRRMAYRIAKMADQLLPRRPGGYDGAELFSEDLW